MKKAPVLLLLGLTACASGAPAGPPPALVTPTMLQPPPIYALIGYRERLQLTPEQIESLDSIAVTAEAQNDSLIDQLFEQGTPNRSQTGLLLEEDGQSTLEQIRQNNRDASEAVGRVLNSEQQGEACSLFRLDRDQRRRNDRGRVRGADPAAADSIWRALESRTWPWCGTTDASSADEDDG